jgi:hypothetical protein
MITDDAFDVRVRELFRQLGDRISTAGDPRSIVHGPDPVPLGNHDPASVGGRRGRWIAMVAAVTLVGLGVAAVVTHDGSVHRITPGVSTDAVDSSVRDETTVQETVAATSVPLAEPVATEPSTSSTLPLPKDPYREVATMLQAAEDVSYRAMVKAVTECMLDQGYTYQSVPDPVTGMADYLTTHEWNAPTLEVAAARGYLRPGEGIPVENPDGDTGFGTSAYQHALYGNVVDDWELPPGETARPGFAVGGPIMDGCRPTAQIQINGGGNPAIAFRIVDYFDELQTFRNQALTAIAANPDYIAAVAAWATCMIDHGYNYASLDEPRHAAWANPRPGSAEIATATQDASCQSEVGLTELGDRLFNDLISDLFAQQPTEYAAITHDLAAIMDRANAVLAS